MPERPRQPSQKIARQDDELSPLAPFRSPVFRMLWGTWLVAKICLWMSDVAAANVALHDRKLALHVGASPPKVTRSVMESTL